MVSLGYSVGAAATTEGLIVVVHDGCPKHCTSPLSVISGCTDDRAPKYAVGRNADMNR